LLSIAIPLHDEEESVVPLVAAIRDAMSGWREDWELILVDDGSTDATASVVEVLARGEARIRLLRLARNFGQSAALQAAFDHARGEVVVTLDGDLQNDPADIPALVEKLAEGYDLVAGYRAERKDALLTRHLPSIVANALLRGATGVAVRDTGCSLKAFRRELLGHLRLYSDFHRFIPALAVRLAGARIAELPVRHHPRRFGRSKYGISRVMKVLADLITLSMLRRFHEEPLLMFLWVALAGAVLAVASGAIGVAVALGAFEGGSPVILGALAACWATFAGFLFMVGLVGEALLHERATSDPFGGRLLRRAEP
jgi:glycosyltransferase involved in cell wall biosynthesis